jgi:hypothetical protein
MATRTHNEYFRRVFLRTVYTHKVRPASLIDEILSRPDCKYTREQLEAPYESFDGYESRCKSCPTCGSKLEQDEWIWSWGEYVHGKWNTVKHFCKQCYPKEVKQLLIEHRNDCGCNFQLVGYSGEALPNWLSLPPECTECEDQGTVICNICNGEGYLHDVKCPHCDQGYVPCESCKCSV